MIRIIRKLEHDAVLVEGPTFDRERVTETMLDIQCRLAEAVLGPNVKPRLLDTEGTRDFFRQCRKRFDAGGAVAHSITGPYVMFLCPLGHDDVIANFDGTFETQSGKPVDTLDVTPSFSIEIQNPDPRNDATCRPNTDQRAFVLKFLEPEFIRHGIELAPADWIKVRFPHEKFGTGTGEFRLHYQHEFY